VCGKSGLARAVLAAISAFAANRTASSARQSQGSKFDSQGLPHGDQHRLLEGEMLIFSDLSGFPAKVA
jgi:hypothetical protein